MAGKDMEILLILQIVSAILTMVEKSSVASTRINELIGKARREQRDITVEELRQIANETDAMAARVLDKLRAPDPPAAND